jgi:hypothetical protein
MIVFPAVQIKTAAGDQAQSSTTSERHLYRYAEQPRRGKIVSGQNCFQCRDSFHLSEKVTSHSLNIWGSQNTHEVVEHERVSPKVNVFCAVSGTQVYVPFFIAETTIKGHVCLDMLGVLPCSSAGCKMCFLATKRAAPHCHRDVTQYLNQTFPGKWLGHGGYIPWPQITRSDTNGLFILEIHKR